LLIKIKNIEYEFSFLKIFTQNAMFKQYFRQPIEYPNNL